jgi:hypothetical protein
MSHSYSPPSASLPPGWVACQSPDGRTFYHHPQTQASSWELPPCTPLPPPPPPFAPHPSAPPLSLSAVSPDDTVDPDLQPLVGALIALKIGVSSTCAVLAVSLSQEGIMGLDDLQLLSEAKARDVLVRVGLKEVPQLKIMQAVAPPRAAVSAQQVAAPAASSPPLSAACSLVLVSLTPSSFPFSHPCR